MKKLLLIVFLLLFVIVSIRVLADAGTPIPKPKISISEAADLASKHLRSGKTKVVDAGQVKINEYIVISAEYTNNFKGKRGTEWDWKVKLVHPVFNDHTVTYKVTGDKKIVELAITE